MTTQGTEANTIGQAASGTPGFAPLAFDVEAYLPHLMNCDLTDKQQRMLLSALWSMMVGFVDLRLRIAPVQQAPENNGLFPEDSGTMLASVPAIASQFTTSAAPLDGRAQERKET